MDTTRALAEHPNPESHYNRQHQRREDRAEDEAATVTVELAGDVGVTSCGNAKDADGVERHAARSRPVRP